MYVEQLLSSMFWLGARDISVMYYLLHLVFKGNLRTTAFTKYFILPAFPAKVYLCPSNLSSHTKRLEGTYHQIVINGAFMRGFKCSLFLYFLKFQRLLFLYTHTQTHTQQNLL